MQPNTFKIENQSVVSMPQGVPEEFHDLLRNINMIDELKTKIEQQYTCMDEQLSDVADILSETKMTKSQLKARVQDFFYTLPDTNGSKSRHREIDNSIKTMLYNVENIQVPKKVFVNSTSGLEFGQEPKVCESGFFKDSNQVQISQNIQTQINQYKDSLQLHNLQFDSKFPLYSSLHQRSEKQIKFAHEQRKIWLQANFDNVDPKFFKKWKQQEIKIGLMCENCKKDTEERCLMKAAGKTDNNIIEELDAATLETMSNEDAQMLQELITEQKNCKECSREWCKFTQDMLNDYALNTFSEFNIKNSMKISTNMHTRDRNVQRQTKKIEIDFKVKPSFFVIDDDQPLEENINFNNENFQEITRRYKPQSGKRVVYFNNVHQISCRDPEFRGEKFKYRLNYMAQMRMQASPYKVKNFALGCFHDKLEGSSEKYEVATTYSSVVNPVDNKTQFERTHSLTQVIQSNLTPESIPMDPNEKFIQMGLASRYQRYELMSCIPVGILIRSIRDKYFQQEIKNLEDFYSEHYYIDDIPTQIRTRSHDQ